MGSLIKMAIEDSGRNPIQRSGIHLTADTQAILLQSNPTDAGNADAFSAMYSGLLRFNHTRATWLIWNGVYWQPDTTGKIHQLAIQTAKEMYKAVSNWDASIELRQARAKWAIHLENNRPRNDMLSTAETIPAMATVEAQFDSDPLLLGVANGTLELSTGIFREARQEDYITKSTHVHYDPNAVCPTWIRFINDLFDGDAEMVAYMQRAIGYTLTGFNKEQIMFLMYGGGSNGKSTFLDTMNKLMGDYASATAFSTFDADNRSDNTNDLARLKGARFVAIVETNQEKRLDESKVKSVTGSDKISARFLYKEFFDYTPQFKIWLAVNHKPIIRGTDNGIWRRLQTIPFLQSFEGSRTNLDMPTLLQQELPGILNWALEGLREYTKQRLNPPEIIKAAAREYRNESDMVLQWLNEQATIDNQEFVAAGIAYSNFRGWCEDSGIRYVLTKISFSKRLQEKGFDIAQKRVEGKNSRIYTGFTCGLYSP